jgi:Gram-negative bacterial TonB protein C-terminal
MNMPVAVKPRVLPGHAARHGGAPMPKRFSLWLMIFVLVNCCAPGGRAEERREKPQFHAVGIASATEIAYPVGAVASGTLVLEAKISADGAVEEVEVRRALEPFTDPSVRAIKSWNFRPATLAGKRIASRVTIAVTFNPRMEAFEDVPLPPLGPGDESEGAHPKFEPAGVEHAVFPKYPAAAANPGTTVLECFLNEEGEVQHTKVVRDFPPFTEKALAAVQDWEFSPARLSDEPVSSRVVLAFVFPPLIHPPRPNDH